MTWMLWVGIFFALSMILGNCIWIWRLKRDASISAVVKVEPASYTNRDFRTKTAVQALQNIRVNSLVFVLPEDWAMDHQYPANYFLDPMLQNDTDLSDSARLEEISADWMHFQSIASSASPQRAVH